MAEFPPAFAFLMNHEDSQRQWKVVPDSCPQGCEGPCFAISGINSGAWPDAYAQIAALSQEDRGASVADFYLQHFWMANGNWQINDQDVANRMLDQGVWSGPGTAVKLLQRALQGLGRELTADGLWGPVTLAAVNGSDPAALLSALREQRLTYLVALKMYQDAPPKVQAGYRARAMA